MLSVPRWDIDNKVNKHYDNIKGEIIKAENYADWKEKYYNVSEKYSDTDLVSKATTFNTINDIDRFEDLTSYCLSRFNITIDDNIKSLDLDAIKQPLIGIENVISEFPEVGKKFSQLTTSKSGIMSCGLDGKITYNPKYFKVGNNMDETIKTQIDSAWWPKNSSLQSIGCHETAHALEGLLIDLNTNYQYDWEKVIAWNECTEAKKIISQACKNIKKTEYGKGKKNAELIRSISGYASKNASETMAEAFADVYANNDNANPLSLEIKKLTVETYNKYKKGGI